MKFNLQGEQKTLVVSAHATDDYANSPSYCVINITQDFLKQLDSIRALCKKHKLSEARVYMEPNLWGPAGFEEEARLQGGELVVTQNNFWFFDHGKYAIGHYESGAIDFNALQKLIANHKQDAVIFDSDELQELYEEDHCEQEA